MRRLILAGVVLAVLVPCDGRFQSRLEAQSGNRIELKLKARPALDSVTETRLLPADTELKSGNAAVVMLRTIWEQQPYMQKVVPKFVELLELPYDDERIARELRFDGFQRQLRRAAYMRDAEWNYPLNEERMAMILLPDVQGFRDLAGRGMQLWIRQQIAAGNTDQAREGILVQLACARHVARTPILVIRFVADSIGQSGLDSAELLVQQADCPNLYWALAMLPDELGDTRAVVQWEARMVPGSLPSLSDPMPGIGDARWQAIWAEFSELMRFAETRNLTAEQRAELKSSILATARKRLAEWKYDESQQAGMSEEEIVLRWVLMLNQRINAQVEAAISLPVPQAIKRLVQIEASVEDVRKKVGASAVPFLDRPAYAYIASQRFSRRVRQLQVVEAIRHYAAGHDGQLPRQLSDIDLHIPLDPLTLKPFQYEVVEGRGVLRTPTIPGVQDARQHRHEYVIAID